jgi:hypothetical protein
MTTAISILSQMPENKAQIDSFVATLKNEVLSGTAEPLYVAVFLKTLEDVVAKLRKDKDVQDVIKDKLLRNSGKIEYSGCTLEIRNRTTYDYSNDGNHVEITNEINRLKEEMKVR